MSDIMTKNGDLVVLYGDIAICNDDNDIIQQAVNSIATAVGENVFHPEFGNPSLNNRMKYTESYLDSIEEGCRTAILQDERVASIENISISLSEDNNTSCDISFVLKTIEDIELTSTCTIDL